MKSNPLKGPSPTPLPPLSATKSMRVSVYQHDNTPKYFSQKKSIRENFSQSNSNLIPNPCKKMAPTTNQLSKKQTWKINFTQTKSMREDFYERKGIREKET
ncbi:hypothetical protein AMTRI_Chr13g90100 [Amborella trichopoda]